MVDISRRPSHAGNQAPDALPYHGWDRRGTRPLGEPETGMAIQPPAWVTHAVFSQLFPDRVARSVRRTPPQGMPWRPWGSPPE
jgi:hypothetical protein